MVFYTMCGIVGWLLSPLILISWLDETTENDKGLTLYQFQQKWKDRDINNLV